MNADSYILTARLLAVISVILAIAGIGGLVWLISDCLRVQRQSNALDHYLNDPPCLVCGKPIRICREHLKQDKGQATHHTREWRRHFNAHSNLNPTFPQR